MFDIGITILVLPLVVFVIFIITKKALKKNKQSNTITTNNEDTEYQEIYNAVYKDFSECGYFKTELLPQLLEKLHDIIINKNGYFSDLFSYDDCLSLEEKKKFGYPTRQKISREMIDSLSDAGLQLKNPKETINDLYGIHSSIIHRKYKLIEMRQQLEYDDDLLGYRIIACLDSETCIVCGAFDNMLLKNSNDIDNFEKHKCRNKYCRCEIIELQKGMGGSDGITYSGWLRKQSVDIKKEILGDYYEQYKSGKSLKEIIKGVE